MTKVKHEMVLDIQHGLEGATSEKSSNTNEAYIPDCKSLTLLLVLTQLLILHSYIAILCPRIQIP